MHWATQGLIGSFELSFLSQTHVDVVGGGVGVGDQAAHQRFSPRFIPSPKRRHRAAAMLAQRALPVGEALDTALYLLERPFGEPERAAGISQLHGLLRTDPRVSVDLAVAERLSSLLRALMAHIERASEQRGPTMSRDGAPSTTDVQAAVILGDCLACILVSRSPCAEAQAC